MSIFELFNPFWEKHGEKSFSPVAVALFHYLLATANKQKWNMPIIVHTTFLAYALKTTKQSILRARSELDRRGVLHYVCGAKKEATKYFLLCNTAIDRTHNKAVYKANG